jgi:hypothetical protein
MSGPECCLRICVLGNCRVALKRIERKIVDNDPLQKVSDQLQAVKLVEHGQADQDAISVDLLGFHTSSKWYHVIPYRILLVGKRLIFRMACEKDCDLSRGGTDALSVRP